MQLARCIGSYALTCLRFLSCLLSGCYTQLPNLLGQETSGLAQHLRLLFRLCDPSETAGDKGDKVAGAAAATGGSVWDRVAYAEKRVRSLCGRLLRDFGAKEAAVAKAAAAAAAGGGEDDGAEAATAALEAEEELAALVPIVVVTLRGACSFSDAQVRCCTRSICALFVLSLGAAAWSVLSHAVVSCLSSYTQLRRNMAWLYPAAVGLLASSNDSIRAVLREFFGGPVRGLLRDGVQCDV